MNFEQMVTEVGMEELCTYASSNLENRNSSLEKAKLEISDVYLIEISIHRGVSSVGIPPRILGIDAEQEKALKKNGISNNTIKVFKNLDTAYNKLDRFRVHNIYPHLLRYDNFRFCHKRNLERLNNLVEELLQLHKELLVSVLENYEEGLVDYQERLQDALTAVGLTTEQQGQLMPDFVRRFPAKETIARNFRVSIFASAANLPQALVNRAADKLLTHTQESLDKAMLSAIEHTRESVLTKLQCVFAQFKDTKNISTSLKTQLQHIAEEARTLLDFDQSLSSIADLLPNTVSMAEYNSVGALEEDLLKLEHLVSDFVDLKSKEEQSGVNAQADYMLF